MSGQDDLGIICIDHITLCVNNLKESMAFCSTILGMQEFAYFGPQTSHSGMISTVMKMGDVKFAINEGTSEASQITQFVKAHGEGVQHIALRVQNLEHVVSLLKQRGLEFITPILEDQDDKGKLYQIFSKPVWGGLFLSLFSGMGAKLLGKAMSKYYTKPWKPSSLMIKSCLNQVPCWFKETF